MSNVPKCVHVEDHPYYYYSSHKEHFTHKIWKEVTIATSNFMTNIMPLWYTLMVWSYFMLHSNCRYLIWVSRLAINCQIKEGIYLMGSNFSLIYQLCCSIFSHEMQPWLGNNQTSIMILVISKGIVSFCLKPIPWASLFYISISSFQKESFKKQ